MTPFKAGDIVLVKFPYSNLQKAKQRPALVLFHLQQSKKIEIVNIAMITSKVESLRFQGDVELRDWEKSGLLHPSLLRLGKTASLDPSLVAKKLGELSPRDKKSTKTQFSKLYSTWFK